MVSKEYFGEDKNIEFKREIPTKPTKPTNQPINLNEKNNDNDGVENKIVALLRQQPDITTKEIVKKLEITDNQVKYYVKKLKNERKIKRVGTNRKGFWEIL